MKKNRQENNSDLIIYLSWTGLPMSFYLCNQWLFNHLNGKESLSQHLYLLVMKSWQDNGDFIVNVFFISQSTTKKSNWIKKFELNLKELWLYCFGNYLANTFRSFLFAYLFSRTHFIFKCCYIFKVWRIVLLLAVLKSRAKSKNVLNNLQLNVSMSNCLKLWDLKLYC